MDGAERNGMSAAALVRRGLADDGWGWSLGRYGAIAEFARVPGDGAEVRLGPEGGEVAGRLGAIRITLTQDVVPLAYETLSRDPARWQHGLAFCLPAAAAQGEPETLTEIGPDGEAVCARDRDAVLFDMGVGSAAVRACVRTGDAELIAILRASAGRSLLDPSHRAMAAILARSPHRVFASALGRIEVYQGIASERTPDGPHTHLLPRLLAAGRDHSANIPVPGGMVAPLIAYPPNPVTDSAGRPRPFDRAAHAAFQDMLAAWGAPAALAAKRNTEAAIARGAPPPVPGEPMARAERTARRVALRQLCCLHDGPSPALDAWRQAFEPARRA